MTDLNEAIDFTGKILVAMPSMGDARFDHAVIYMCSHSDEGAMGIIVNKPMPDLSLTKLVTQLEIGEGSIANTPEMDVHFGGPVEHGRGFVLHSGDYTSIISSLVVDDVFSMTATLDILEEIAAGRGPAQAIMALGYAGWGPQQLEGEILANGWLTCEASLKLVFETPDAAKWGAALATLGVDPLTLSATAGRA